jgi:hypothetical protein
MPLVSTKQSYTAPMETAVASVMVKPEVLLIILEEKDERLDVDPVPAAVAITFVGPLDKVRTLEIGSPTI